MLRSHQLITLAAVVLLGFTFIAALLIFTDRGFAGSATSGQPPCLCADAAPKPAHESTGSRPMAWPILDETDEIAALEAVQVTLSEVGDGSTFAWYRGNGRISGVLQPTASFKDGSGKICRHIRMMLTAGAMSRKVEGIACRGSGGIWSLEG